MFSIPMGATYIVLGVEWLTTLGTIDMNFHHLFMRFHLEGRIVELRGLPIKSPQMVTSHQIQKMLKKRVEGFVAQFSSLAAYQPIVPI